MIVEESLYKGPQKMKLREILLYGPFVDPKQLVSSSSIFCEPIYEGFF
jgi:hypothetical protein